MDNSNEIRFFEIKVFIPYSNASNSFDGSYTYYSSEGYDFEDACNNLAEKLKEEGSNVVVCYEGYDDESNWISL